jgi:hypothetical protein
MNIASRPRLILFLAAAACAGESSSNRSNPDTVAVQAFSGVPLFPGAGISDVSGEGEAARATLHIRHGPDSASAWYRRALLMRDWNIVSDVTTRDSVITLHATRGGHPIWIMFRRDPSTGGTQATVIGAVPNAEPDSASVRRGRP